MSHPHLPERATGRWRRWLQAGRREAVDRNLRTLYGRLDRAIARRAPTCWLSGRCCHFESYGHRLYVTGLEVAWLVGRLDPAGRDRLRCAGMPGSDGCPFQTERLCGVHALRPLGCRIYFCDPTARAWQGPLYERLMRGLRGLHRRHGVEYAYLEWRTALLEVRPFCRSGFSQ